MLKFLVVVSLIASSYSAFAQGCMCTAEYNPVCGNNGQTYDNPCVLQCAQSTNPSLQQISFGQCPRKIETCNCPKIYRPVCGSNKVTYSNTCMLGCAQRTDPSLQMLRTGSCQ